MARELFNLIGGRAPVAPASGYTKEKAKLGARQPAVKWVHAAFVHPGRADAPTLRHWVRADAVHAEYSFARFNKTANVPVFTPAEYAACIGDHVPWSLSDTVLLFDLCAMLDLRFVLVHDRFRLQCSEAARAVSVEDCKARFYSARARLLDLRGATASSREQTYHFDATHEERRKTQLLALQARTFDEICEERSLQQQLKSFDDHRRHVNQLARGGGAGAGSSGGARFGRPSAPAAAQAAAAAAAALASSSTGFAAPLHTLPPGVYLRSAVANRVFVKSKLAAAITKVCVADLGIPEMPVPTAAVVQAHNEVRQLIATVQVLRTNIQVRAQELALLKHSAGGSDAGASRKRPMLDVQPEGASPFKRK